jgi:hypothetical protein
VRYIEESPRGENFRVSGIPQRNARLHSFHGDDLLATVLRFYVGQETHFQVRIREREFNESWKVQIDLHSNLFIESSCGAKLYFVISAGLFTAISFWGSRNSTLYGFFLACSRIPFGENDLEWEDSLPARYLFHPIGKLGLDIFGPFGEPIKLVSQSKITREKEGVADRVWTIKTELRCRLFHWETPRSCRDLRLSFSATDGILAVRMIKHGNVFLEAKKAPVYPKHITP